MHVDTAKVNNVASGQSLVPELVPGIECLHTAPGPLRKKHGTCAVIRMSMGEQDAVNPSIPLSDNRGHRIPMNVLFGARINHTHRARSGFTNNPGIGAIQGHR